MSRYDKYRSKIPFWFIKPISIVIGFGIIFKLLLRAWEYFYYGY